MEQLFTATAITTMATTTKTTIFTTSTITNITVIMTAINDHPERRCLAVVRLLPSMRLVEMAVAVGHPSLAWRLAGDLARIDNMAEGGNFTDFVVRITGRGAGALIYVIIRLNVLGKWQCCRRELARGGEGDACVYGFVRIHVCQLMRP